MKEAGRDRIVVLTCCKSEKGIGSLASTWWGWLVRDGSGGGFFQWVRLLLSTAKRVLAKREGTGRTIRLQLALPCPGKPQPPGQGTMATWHGSSQNHSTVFL